MSAGLVVGIVLGAALAVIILAVLVTKLYCLHVRRKEQRKTQIYYLPPPVQGTRSMSWTRPAADEITQPKRLSPPCSAPTPVDMAHNSAPSIPATIPRIRTLRDISPIPPDLFTRPRSTSNSSRNSIQESVHFFSHTAVDSDHLRSQVMLPAATTESPLTVAHVPARRPAMSKASTFRSEIATPRFASNTNSSGNISPRILSRSSSHYSGSSPSPSSAVFSIDTPVVRTAVVYDFSGNNLRRYTQASMVHIDEGVPPVPELELSPTVYVPYRPPRR